MMMSLTTTTLLLPQLLVAQQTLEEVIVTAERREQSLQDTPISATVLTNDIIETKGIDDIYGVQNAAPSLSITEVGRSTFINIRGVGIARSAPTTTPGVAYYNDGVFIAKEVFIGNTFYDLKSIEVLRGPQGTLTGQNSTGGAVYVRTPEPEYEKMFGYIDQTFGDYDRFRTIAAVNVPISDNAAIRVAGTYNTSGSFSKCLNCPTTPGDDELYAIRANLQYEPSDSMKFNLRAEYFNSNTGNLPIKSRNDPITPDPFVLNQDGVSFLDREGLVLSGEARIDLTPGIQMRALFSYQDYFMHDGEDGDRTSNDPARPAGTGRVSDTTSDFDDVIDAEINFLSTGDGPLQWVAGAFYFEETGYLDLFVDQDHTVNFISPTFSLVLGPRKTTSVSGFGQVDYRFSDKWELTLGVRYSEDEQDMVRVALPGPPALNPGCFPCSNKTTSDEITGRVGLKYHMDEENMIYMTASKGYKGGGLNPNIQMPPYDPETNEVYELGLKSTLMDDHLRLNADIFYSDYEGLQLPARRPLGGVGPLLPLTDNAPAIDSIGAELELTGVFDQLGFDLGISYLDSEFSESGTLTDPRTNANGVVNDGSPNLFSPKWTVNAGIQHDFLVNDTVITPRLQVSHIAKQYVDAFVYPETTLPSRTLVDLRIAVVPGEKWRFEGFITNLFDNTYIVSQREDSTTAGGGSLYGAPRQVGFRLKYSF